MNILILGYGKMGHLHGKILSELDLPWEWFDPRISDRPLNLNAYSHVIISTPILTHHRVYQTLESFPGPILIEKPAVVQRCHLPVLDDGRVSVGLQERFNAAVQAARPGRVASVEFYRTVKEARDNLFLEIAIHDLDLMTQLLPAGEVEILDFGSGFKTDYYLKLRYGGVPCSFRWGVEEKTQRTITIKGKPDFFLDLMEQRTTVDGILIESKKTNPLKEELNLFLSGKKVQARRSHEILIRILEF